MLMPLPVHLQSALGNAQAVYDDLLCEEMEMRYKKTQLK